MKVLRNSLSVQLSVQFCAPFSSENPYFVLSTTPSPESVSTTYQTVLIRDSFYHVYTAQWTDIFPSL